MSTENIRLPDDGDDILDLPPLEKRITGGRSRDHNSEEDVLELPSKTLHPQISHKDPAVVEKREAPNPAAERYEANIELTKKLFQAASHDKHIRGIIAYLILTDLDYRNILSEYDVFQFLEAYRDGGPILLANNLHSLFKNIQKQNGAQKLEEYEGAFRTLLSYLYDDATENWEHIRVILEEDPNDKKAVFEQGSKMYSIEQLSEVEQEEARARVGIHGHPFGGRSLSVDDLAREELLPEHKVITNGMVVWFSSNAYEINDRRYAVVGYVEQGTELVARSYYLSGSQGVWRYLPAYETSWFNQEEIGHYNKGWGEESITLPISMQQALAEITAKNPPKQVKDPDFIFAGTARDKFKLEAREDITYVRQVEAQPRKLYGTFYSHSEMEKQNPESMQFTNEEEKPDFSKQLSAWAQESPIYGRVEIEVFASKDGEFKYMFCTDPLGRTWIGGIEDSSPVQSTGLRRSWIKAGDLTCPAYEYLVGNFDQTGGYGNTAIRKGNYVDMSKNYLRHIPVIREYVEAKSARENKKRNIS